MQITGVTLDQFADVVRTVSNDDYDSNVIMHTDSHDLGGVRRPRIQARIRTITSVQGDYVAPGARRGHSGRRIPSGCWHAYRDVLAMLFERYPTAIVRTAQAVYNGKHDFENKFEATGNTNIGSQFSPLYYADACDCN